MGNHCFSNAVAPLYADDHCHEDHCHDDDHCHGTLPCEECSICLEVVDGDDVLKTNCGHVFHRDCIIEALMHNKNCPNCRAEVYKLEKPVNTEDEQREPSSGAAKLLLVEGSVLLNAWIISPSVMPSSIRLAAEASASSSRPQ